MSRVAVVTGGPRASGWASPDDSPPTATVWPSSTATGRRPRRRPASCAAGVPTALAVEVDVADRASVDAAFARVRGRTRARSRSSSPAPAIESFDPLLEITPEKWDRIIAVNLTGTFTCVQAAVPDMVAAGWGRIVTISSSSAQSGAPNMAHYAASKGGVIALTKALAVDLARQRHHRQHHPPSLVDTPMARDGRGRGDFPGVDVVGPMVPLGRAGTPADIAAACSFLCSDEAAATSPARSSASTGACTSDPRG